MLLQGATTPGAVGGAANRALIAAAVGGLALALTLVIAEASTSVGRTRELALVAATMVLLGVIVRNVRRLLLVVVVFDIALQWDVNLGYQSAAAKLGAFAGLNISATTIALVGLYALWLADRLGRAAATKLQFRLGVPLMVYIGLAAVSVLAASNQTLALDQTILFVQTFLLFLYVASTVRSRADVEFFVGALLASLAFESLLILALHATGGNLKLPGVNSQSYAADAASQGVQQNQLRIGGTVGPPNTTGAYLSLLLAPAILTALAPVKRRLRQLGAVSFGLGTISLILTFSRGGWIGFGVSMSIMLFAGWRRGLFRARVPIGVVLGLLVLILPFANQISGRLNKSDGGAAHSRVPLIQIAKHVIVDHPLFGVGTNNLAVRLPDYETIEAEHFLYVVHNRYLLIWAESGGFALLAYLWFLGSTLRRGLRCTHSRDDFISLIGLGFFAGIAGHMVHMLFDTFQGRPIVQLLWLIAGLVAAMAAMVDRDVRFAGARRR